PSTVRALAQCFRALLENRRALELYREYLESKPADAAQIEATVRELESQIGASAPPAAADAARASPGVAPPPAVVSPPVVAPVSPVSPVSPDQPAQSTRKEAEPKEESSVLSSPVLWIVAGVVVVGGAVALGFALR